MSRRILRLALVVALVHVCSLNRVALADPLQELEAVKTQLKTPVEVVTKAESDATKVKQEFDQPKTALHDAVKQHAQGATTAVKDAERLLKRLTRAAEEAQDLQDQSEETVNRLRMEIAKEKDPAKRPPLETKHSGAVTALAKATTTNLILKQGLEDAMAQLKTMKEQLKKINTASKDVAAGMKPIDPMDNAASAAIVKAALPDLVKLVVPKLLEEIKQGSLKADPATPGAGLPPAPAPGPVVAAKTPRVHGLVLVTGEPTLRQNALQSVIQLKTCLEQAQRQTPNLFRSVTSLGAN